MWIYILHENYLNIFKLPNVTSGSYFIQDIDSHYSTRNLVAAYIQDGKWYIKSNDSVQIVSGYNKIDSCEISVNNSYLLRTKTGDSVILYPHLPYDNHYIIKEVDKDCTLVVGTHHTCDIFLNSAIIGSKQMQLTYSSNHWHLKNLNPKIPIFVNYKRVDECTLDDYDTIYIMGFRMMICGKLLYILNDSERIRQISDKLHDKSSLYYAITNVDTSNQVYTDFYKPDDYFSKSPIFVKKINTYHLDIIKPKVDQKVGSFSVFMEVIPSILMSATSIFSGLNLYKEYKSGNATKESMMMSILTIGILLFASIVWPFISHFIEKSRVFIKNKEYDFKYNRYLKKVGKELENEMNLQKEALIFNNISLQNCQKAILEKNNNLFSVNYNQERFLNVRLGTGKVKMDIQVDFQETDEIEEKSVYEDQIKKLISNYKYIDGAPFSFNLKNSIAFINPEGNFEGYLKAIILQLMCFYDYYNLKIVVLTSESSKLNIIRNLRHCWSIDESLRYFATNLQEAEVISSNLIRIMNENEESKQKDSNVSNTPKTHYLIICDEVTKYRSTKIFERVLEAPNYCGFSCLFFARKINEVPNGCQYFLGYTDKTANLFELEMAEDSFETFTPEFVDDSIDFSECVRTVSNIPLLNNFDMSNNGQLPDKVGFLEMFNVGNVDQLNVLNRWKNSQVTNTLATPIGIDTTGNVFQLDLHEKAHGPHGLIAGMTGSGKSETIVTYILSLSVNYSPYEVQFVLIDYKGGGLAGAFENRKTGLKLPHLVGTITNLDKASMNRTLVSIKSELQRRQKVFNAAKEDLDIATIDIYKYQELVRNGSIKEPMAHLFIICDEFAELKAQQPDFMDELVSAARIGRSLGIHLILATQKPSGVVDAQIWANSKFKICAKVQTAEDSNEMIRRPDAASIKETGRFYLQVGYDEIFTKAQSAYTGVKYVPHESAHSNNANDNNSIMFVDDLGNVIKSATYEEKQKVSNEVDYGDELGNVTKYLIECAKSIGYKNQQLWLDNVPNELYYNDIIKKYPFQKKPYLLSTVIGEYDDPANQKQGVVQLNFNETGSILAIGNVGTGKTTLLSTIIYSLIINYSTAEVNIIIIDYISGILKKYEEAPQVADVVTVSEKDKAKKMFYFLKREYERRLKVLSESGNNFMYYINNEKPPFPTMVIFLNGYGIIHEQDYDLCDDVINVLMREGSRVGMYFVTTATPGNNGKIEEYHPQKVVYQIPDPSDYVDYFTNYEKGLVPADNPGRGLVEINGTHEFQTARLFPENEDDNLRYIFDKLKESLPKAEGMPVIPKVVTTKDVLKSKATLKDVPVGIEILSNCVCSFNFDYLVNLIMYKDPMNAKEFSNALIKVMQTIPNLTFIWLDGLEIESDVENVKKFNENFSAVCNSLHKTILEKKTTGDEKSENTIIFIITGYSVISKHIEEVKKENPEVKSIDDLIMASLDSNNYRFILFDSTSLKSIDNRNWVDYFDYDRGMILACDPEDQELFSAPNYYGDTKFTRDVASIIDKEEIQVIKYVRR